MTNKLDQFKEAWEQANDAAFARELASGQSFDQWIETDEGKAAYDTIDRIDKEWSQALAETNIEMHFRVPTREMGEELVELFARDMYEAAYTIRKTRKKDTFSVVFYGKLLNKWTEEQP